jgi:hypothetical protein
MHSSGRIPWRVLPGSIGRRRSGLFWGRCNLHFIEDKKEWKDTQVVFDISSDGSTTAVTMTHAGLVPGVECYDACKKGWDFYILESLQKLLRENKGIPDGQRRQESAANVGAETR